jgi:hypothetical protein
MGLLYRPIFAIATCGEECFFMETTATCGETMLAMSKIFLITSLIKLKFGRTKIKSALPKSKKVKLSRDNQLLQLSF